MITVARKLHDESTEKMCITSTSNLEDVAIEYADNFIKFDGHGTVFIEVKSPEGWKVYEIHKKEGDCNHLYSRPTTEEEAIEAIKAHLHEMN